MPPVKPISQIVFVSSLTFTKGCYCTIQTSLRKALVSPLPTLIFQPAVLFTSTCVAHTDLHLLYCEFKNDS